MAEASLHSVQAGTDQITLLNRYIECAEYLIQKCKELNEIPGAGKLERKCAAELKYLRSLSRRRGGYDVTHLRSSNLSHYAGVLNSAYNLPDVTHILQAFSCPGRTEPLHMDVVAGQGHIWVKVVARKAQALHLIWGGQGQYGEKDIIMQAKDFIVCSKVHPVNFQDPKVVFAFYNGVTYPVVEGLQKCGIIVLGEIVEVDCDIDMKLLDLGVEETDSSEESCNSSDDEIESEDVDSVEKENTGKGVTCSCSSDRQQIPFDNAGMDLCCLFCGKRYTYRHVEDVNGNARLKCDKDETEISCQSPCTEKNSSLESELSQNNEHLKSDSSYAVAEEISDLGSSRYSEVPLTDLSTNNPVIYHIDYNVKQESAETDSTTLTSIDSHISEIGLQTQTSRLPFVATDEQSTEINLGTSDTAKMTSVQYCPPKNQFQPKIDSGNKTAMKCDFSLDKWGNASVLSFICTELLLNPVLDFHLIRKRMANDELNSIDKIGKINLDITALITLVSSVSHGGCYYRFREKILSEQAAEERVDPVLPKLQAFIEGKDLYACQTAVESFKSILDTLGGDQEKVRASELLTKLTVVPDKPSFRSSMIPNTGKIKDRSKIIFGTGDSLRAVTVTANSGFVRAAEHQGVTFAVFLHASRALTEQKESTAEKLLIDS